MGYDNELVSVDDELYFVQGYKDDSQIQMYRSVDDLLECERDAVQEMIGDDDNLDRYLE